MRSRDMLVTILVLAPIVLAGTCRKQVPTSAAPEPEPSSQKVEPAPGAEAPKEVTESFPNQPVEVSTPPTESSIDELNRKGVLQTVYFDYDKTDLSDATRATLQGNSEWLRSNPKRTIRIEGHCDERGTIEYNINLGDRRASAIRDCLTGLGVNATRMRIVSYGEERPVDPGHAESAWSKNRRAEFYVES